MSEAEVHLVGKHRYYGGPKCRCPTCKENQKKIRELEKELIDTAGRNVDLTTQTIIRFTEAEVREALLQAAHAESPDYDNIIRSIILKRKP